MSEQETGIKFPKLDEYEMQFVKEFENIKFYFICDIKDKKIRLSLKEINALSPYYYESFFTLEELKKKSSGFNYFDNMNDCCDQLKDIYKDESTKLVSKDGDMMIHFEIPIFRRKEIVDIILKKKTLEEKDEVLKALYDIEKQNYNIFKEIASICQENSSQQGAKEILVKFQLEEKFPTQVQ